MKRSGHILSIMMSILEIICEDTIMLIRCKGLRNWNCSNLKLLIRRKSFRNQNCRNCSKKLQIDVWRSRFGLEMNFLCLIFLLCFIICQHLKNQGISPKNSAFAGSFWKISTFGKCYTYLHAPKFFTMAIQVMLSETAFVDGICFM